MKYIKRYLEARLAEVLDTHPAAVLTGPRQVGKSTLLENASFLKHWKYLTMDDDDVLSQALEDPKGLIIEDRPTIIDEVQRHPKLFLTIKYYVDRSKRKRKFILSGSGNVSLRRPPRESLAGRAKYLHLTPLSFSEMTPCESLLPSLLQSGGTKSQECQAPKNTLDAIWRGGLPGVQGRRPLRAVIETLGGYIDTYIERDIQDLVRVRNPENFRQLMRILAQSTGWEANQDELSSACGESRSNVSRYISLMRETGLLYQVKGYALKGEKAYRQAKYYWYDSGVACFLSGVYAPKELSKGGQKGRFFENLIFQQLLTFLSMQVVPSRIYYWKPKRENYEVDFVLKVGNTILPIEVKASKALAFRDTRSVRKFLAKHKEANLGIVVYNGSKAYRIGSQIFAIPWTGL